MAEINKSEYVIMYKRDGYLEGRFIKPTKIDMVIAKSMIEQRKKLTDYQTTAVLIDGRNVKGVTKDARDYLGSEPGFDLIKAAAILSGSPLSAFILNFFIKVNIGKSKVPLRLFSDKEKAIKWLKAQ